jgi:hypothetical protein
MRTVIPLDNFRSIVFSSRYFEASVILPAASAPEMERAHKQNAAAAQQRYMNRFFIINQPY